MIVSEIVSVFQAILRGLNDNAVVNSLINLQTHITNRNTQNIQSVMQQSASVRAKFMPLSRIDPFQYRSIPIREFLNNTVYGSLTINKVSGKVLTLAVESPNFLPASGEVAAYVAFLNEQIVAMSQFVQTAATFPDTGLSHSADTVFLVLQLPKSIFSEDMKTLSKDLEEFDRFISGIHQLATGKSDRPKLLYTSSSDFLYYLQYSVSALPAFFPIFNQCLDSAERLIKVLSAISVLRQAQNGSVGIEGMIEEMTKQTTSAVETAIQSASEAIARPEGSDISAVSVQINLSSRYVINRICQGAKLSFDIKNEQEASVFVKNFPASETIPEPLKTIADQSSIQMKIDTALTNSADRQTLPPLREDH